MNFGAPELLIVLAVVLLLFGSTRLPALARSLGQAKREFQDGEHESSTETVWTRKRWAALAAVLVSSTTLVLSGCGGNGSADPPPTTRTEDSQPSAPQDTSSNPNPQPAPQSGNVP